MAKPQDQLPLNLPYTTPIIMEHEQEGRDVSVHHHSSDDSFSGNCFSLFCCFDNRHLHDGETATFLHQSGDLINHDTWFMKRAKSLKEFSEVVAGPKWKNFIRRFSKRPKARSSVNTPFQYDPQSYALNFNDGDDHEDDDLLPRSFSTRFAPPSRPTPI